jgi:outer membrane protein assembly factor BamB
LLWKAEDIGKGYSTVAIGWGTIYTTGDVEGKLRLFAFGLDGQPRWQQDQDKAWEKPVPGARATPTLQDGKLYLMSGHGLVVCRDAQDGSLIWERRMGGFGGKVPQWGYSESVLIHDGKAIITPGGRQCVVALSAATGETVWTSEGIQAGAEYGSCIVVRRPQVTMVVGVTKPGLVAVRADNGEKLWTNDYSRGGGVNVPTPVFGDGHLFWPNGFSKGAICLRLGDDGMPTVAWTTDQDRECHLGDFVLDGGYLYGHHGGHWKCIDLRTGEVKWKGKGVGNGSVCWADGMLYLFSEGGGVAGLAVCTPDGFEPRGRFRVEGKGRSWAHPVVIGGRLYLRYDTTLYCFDVRGKD